MPQIQDNNKGQPGGVEAVAPPGVQTIDFLQFVKWHAEAAEPNVGDNLLDSFGLTPEFDDGIGTNVGVLTDGIVGRAREMRTNADKFSRSVSINDAWDLTSQKVDKVTIMGWIRPFQDTVDACFACQIGSTEAAKAWILRSMHNSGGSRKGAAVFFRDNAGGDYDWAFGIPNGGLDPGNYPTNEWCFIGISASISDDRTSGWFYTQTQGQHWESFTGAAAFGAPFNYTTRGVVYFGDNDSDPGTGGNGPNGDIDQIDVMHGIELLQPDVDYFWRLGLAQSFSSGYIIGGEESGRIVHNDHGSTGGNNHGAGSNRQ